MAKDCLFCQIIQGTVPAYKIYEDQKVLAFLDIYPVTQGHTLVIPKKHVVDITAADDQTLKNVAVVVRELAKHYQTVLQAAGFNVRSNHGGKVADQIIPHYHVHLIPRYQGDDLQLTFPRTEGKKAELTALAQKISLDLNKN